jgi:hypothetical protein
VYSDIFLGSEGSCGYLDPFVNKSFTANDEFGLSFISLEARYFTETGLDPDGQQHAKVYENSDSSRPMYLIGFEDTLCGGDKDYQDMIISLTELNHDVAVTDVTPYRGWVYEGQPVDINVTIANLGDFTENVDVDLYYNFTADEKIGTKTILALDPGGTATLTFTWDTTGVPYCHNYTITAVAKITFESNTTNNMLDGSMKIKVRIVGDVNGDGTVDMTDIKACIDAFLTYPGLSDWNPNCDIAPCCPGDDSVDMADISVVIEHFMESCSP